MVGLSLDDLVGEVEPVNVPGLAPEEFGSWLRKLHKPLEALADDPEVAAALPRSRRAPAG
jgi:4-alpha-glucanotransferase